MAFTRDRSRIKSTFTSPLVTINGNDVGYLVEGSLHIKCTPQLITDESGATHQKGVLVEYEFELLQADQQMITDLENSMGFLAQIGIDDDTWALNDVPINIEIDHQYEYGKPRTVKVKGAVKARKLSDIYFEV